MNTLGRQNGVTILELMIGLAITSIVLTLAVPSAQSIIIQNRIVAEINEFSGVVQFARYHAIDEQVDTVVCPTADFSDCGANWDNPKMVFADLNGDGNRNDDEELLVGTSAIASANDMTGPAAIVRFQGSGAVSSPATFLLCHKDDDAKYARALTLSLQGRVKMSQDSNNDSIHEDNDNNNLTCS